MFNRKSLITLIVSGLFTTGVQAATFELKNGKTVQGEIISQSTEGFVVDVQGIEVKLPKEQIASVDMGDSGASAAKAGAASTESASTESASTAAAATTEASQSTASGEVPVGTILTVRTNENLDTRNHQTGYSFTAVLEGNLMSGDQVVAERGSTVYGKLVEVKKAGRVAGKAAMSMQLTGIMINNQVVPLESNVLSSEGENTLKSTAGKTAGAAAIGGLIDGGDGASTGAKVGVGASIITKGDDIQVPQGSLIEFQLSKPLTL